MSTGSTSLRDRIDDAGTAEIQRQAAPVLMALQAAAREVSASTRALEHKARRPTLMQAATLVAAGMLLCALMVLAIPGCWTLSPAAKRHVRLGARLEAVWPSFSESEQALLYARLAAPDH